MNARPSVTLLLVVLLGGCSLFHKDDSGPAGPQTVKKKSSWWPLAKGGPKDATPYLEYRRTRSDDDKSMYALFVRNTSPTKGVEGEIRTTIETAANETTVDTSHFSLGPNETKRLLVYPDKFHLTYEVTAFFKE
jgi:hypothetical protein